MVPAEKYLARNMPLAKKQSKNKAQQINTLWIYLGGRISKRGSKKRQGTMRMQPMHQIL
jgi:hypothetical protein